jgi:hypothetical protein
MNQILASLLRQLIQGKEKGAILDSVSILCNFLIQIRIPEFALRELKVPSG